MRRWRKTFTEVDGPARLAYTSLADFIPGVEPYEFLTVVDLEPTDAGVHVVMTVDRTHDDVWPQRLTQGRENELANLASVVSGGWAPGAHERHSPGVSVL